MLTREEFLKHLRDALNHLHDPDRLRRNPLAAIFGVANRFDAASRLRDILVEAIASLEPGADEPVRSRAWQIYETLFYRYVQQASQREVADQLGICARHVRRKQRAALETLADRLWEQFDLGTRLDEGAEQKGAPPQVQAPLTHAVEDLAWLKDAASTRPTRLQETLPAVLELAQSLAARRGVRLEFTMDDALPALAVQPVAARQILLNLLSAAISRAPGGTVRVSARPLEWEVEIRVQSAASSPHASLSDDERANLDVARQLVEMCGGCALVADDARGLEAVLTLPALERLPVLVIDDHEDTLQLLQRYTPGTRYRLVVARDPEQAIPLAEQVSPQVIVLDVMMPEMDGWEALGRLRQHPRTGRIPVIVCTILAQEALALALGASDFLRKPVTREEFLAALDRQVGTREPARR